MHGSLKVIGSDCVGMVQHLPAHGALCALDSVGLMRMCVVQGDDTPCGHAGVLSLDSSMKVL
jgi:hypothetical protein